MKVIKKTNHLNQNSQDEIDQILKRPQNKPFTAPNISRNLNIGISKKTDKSELEFKHKTMKAIENYLKKEEKTASLSNEFLTLAQSKGERTPPKKN